MIVLRVVLVTTLRLILMIALRLILRISPPALFAFSEYMRNGNESDPFWGHDRIRKSILNYMAGAAPRGGIEWAG